MLWVALVTSACCASGGAIYGRWYIARRTWPRCDCFRSHRVLFHLWKTFPVSERRVPVGREREYAAPFARRLRLPWRCSTRALVRGSVLSDRETTMVLRRVAYWLTLAGCLVGAGMLLARLLRAIFGR